MIEIRFHGRGGQGTVVASVLLAKAFFKDGYYVQTFPSFGVERRGAPVCAYLRLDDQKILVRSNVYNPDHVIVQDRKLLDTIDITNGLKQNGTILINSPKEPYLFEQDKKFNIYYVDAAQIATKYNLGTRTHPIINTTMIGAFAKVLKMPTFNSIADAINKEIKVKTDMNIKAAKEAFETVKIIGGL